jgi:tetratricopeptide (TPR) repeat protein
MKRACAALLLLTGVAAAQEPRWNDVLEESAAALNEGGLDRSLSLAEKAWQLLCEAGPSHPVYSVGVWEVADAFDALGRYQRSDAIYQYAIAAAHRHSAVVRELKVLYAAYLEKRGNEVAAESAWERVLAEEEAGKRPSEIYSAEIVSLAQLKERLGKRENAERLYRLALRQTPTQLSEWPVPTSSGYLPLEREYLRDARLALSDFLMDWQRSDEADEVLREGGGTQYIGRRIAIFEGRQDWDQAVALQRKLIAESPELQDALQDRLQDLLVKAGRLPQPDGEFNRLEMFSKVQRPPAIRFSSAECALENDRSSFLQLLDEGAGTAFAEGRLTELIDRLRSAGRTEDVSPTLQRYILAAERIYGIFSPRTMEVLAASVREYMRSSMTDEARRLLDRLHTSVMMQAGTQSPEMETVLQLRAELLHGEGKSEAASSAYREWLDLLVSLHGASSGNAARAHGTVADFFARIERLAEARSEWLAAVEIARALGPHFSEERPKLLATAAAFLRSYGEPELAASLNADARRSGDSRYRMRSISRAQL